MRTRGLDQPQKEGRVFTGEEMCHSNYSQSNSLGASIPNLEKGAVCVCVGGILCLNPVLGLVSTNLKEFSAR